MDVKYLEIMKELIDEYQPNIDSIENERERRLNEAVIKIAIEVSVRALEKYDIKYGNTSD